MKISDYKTFSNWVCKKIVSRNSDTKETGKEKVYCLVSLTMMCGYFNVTHLQMEWQMKGNCVNV